MLIGHSTGAASCRYCEQVSEEERAIRRLQTEKQQLRLLLLEARGGGWAEKRTQEAVQVAEERVRPCILVVA